jgi:hypothetical protein
MAARKPGSLWQSVVRNPSVRPAGPSKDHRQPSNRLSTRWAPVEDELAIDEGAGFVLLAADQHALALEMTREVHGSAGSENEEDDARAQPEPKGDGRNQH